MYNKKGPNNFLYADQLDGFTPGNEEFLAALDQLLQEGLIKGMLGEAVSSSQSRVAVTLNGDELDRIRRELTPWWKDARLLVQAAIALAGLIWAIVKGIV